MIDPRIERVGVVRQVADRGIVVPDRAGLIEVLGRVKIHELRCVGVEAADWNYIAGERIANEPCALRRNSSDRIDSPGRDLPRRCRIKDRPLQNRAAKRISSADGVSLPCYQIGKIGIAAGFFQSCWHGSRNQAPLPNACPFKISEEKGLVSPDGTAQRTSELILLIFCPGNATEIVAKVISVEFIIAEELPECSMKI